MSTYATNEILVNAAYELMKLRGLVVEPSIIPRLRVSIRPSLERLASRVATNADRKVRNLLRREFESSITVASGTASLSALFSDARPFLESAVRTLDIRGTSGLKIQMLADRASLQQDRPSAFKYGAVEDKTLYTDAANGTYTVSGNFIETDISQLSFELEPWLFEELLGVGEKAA